MGRKRHTPEEIIRKLRGGDAELAGGARVGDESKKLGISEKTFHRWRSGSTACVKERR